SCGGSALFRAKCNSMGGGGPYSAESSARAFGPKKGRGAAWVNAFAPRPSKKKPNFFRDSIGVGWLRKRRTEIRKFLQGKRAAIIKLYRTSESAGLIVTAAWRLLSLLRKYSESCLPVPLRFLAEALFALICAALSEQPAAAQILASGQNLTVTTANATATF